MQVFIASNVHLQIHREISVYFKNKLIKRIKTNFIKNK